MAGGGWLFMTYQYYVQNAAAFGRGGGGARIDLLVCDEAHQLANESERRQVVSAAPLVKRLLLTATPVSNNRRELWSLLDLAHPGCVGHCFKSGWGWMEAGDHGTADSAGQPEEVAAAVRAWWSERAQHFVHALTAKYLLRRVRTAEERGIPPRRD